MRPSVRKPLHRYHCQPLDPRSCRLRRVQIRHRTWKSGAPGRGRRAVLAAAPCDLTSPPCQRLSPLQSQVHGVVARPLFLAGERLRRAGHRPEVDPLPLAGHLKRHPRPARRGWASAWKARAASSRNRAPRSTCSTIAARRAGRSIRCPSSSRPTNGRRSRAASIQRARLLDAVLADLYGPQTLLARAAAAADAGPRQPAFPAALPGHRRQGADPPSRPLRRRPGAARRRPLARAGRPHRGAVGHRLCAGDPPRAGAQPARGVPLRSRCAISGRSSTAGTIRCSPWRQPAWRSPTWRC